MLPRLAVAPGGLFIEQRNGRDSHVRAALLYLAGEGYVNERIVGLVVDPPDRQRFKDQALPLAEDFEAWLPESHDQAMSLLVKPGMRA
jgi:hypothetical protein